MGGDRWHEQQRDIAGEVARAEFRGRAAGLEEAAKHLEARADAIEAGTEPHSPAAWIARMYRAEAAAVRALITTPTPRD